MRGCGAGQHAPLILPDAAALRAPGWPWPAGAHARWDRALDPEPCGDGRHVPVLVERARLLAAAGDWEAAVEAADRVRAVDAGNVHALALSGEARALLGTHCHHQGTGAGNRAWLRVGDVGCWTVEGSGVCAAHMISPRCANIRRTHPRASPHGCLGFRVQGGPYPHWLGLSLLGMRWCAACLACSEP